MEETFYFILVQFWNTVKIYSTKHIWSPAPSSSMSPGVEGALAYSEDFIYFYKEGEWHKFPFSEWEWTPPSNTP